MVDPVLLFISIGEGLGGERHREESQTVSVKGCHWIDSVVYSDDSGRLIQFAARNFVADARPRGGPLSWEKMVRFGVRGLFAEPSSFFSCVAAT